MTEGVRDPLALRRAASPDRVGLIDGAGGTYSYADLDDAATRVAAWIDAEIGADPPTVAVLADRDPAVGPLLWGGLRAGARVAPLDTTLPEPELADRFDRLDGDAVVATSATFDMAAGLESPVLATVDAAESEGAATLAPFADDRAPATRSEGLRPGGELVVFTSGSTGEPKGVRLDLPTLVASGVASTLRLGAAPDDRWLVPIPTYHVGGLAPLIRCTQAGTTVLFQPTGDAERTIDLIATRSITCVSLVPTQLRRLFEAGWEPPDRLRFVLLGGGPIPQALVEQSCERGVPVCPTYGMTETASQVATARPAEARENPDTVGRPVAFTDVTIVDDGVAQPAGSGGEIVVDGPTVTAGYLETGRDGPAFDDLGFHTGDRGVLDERGRLRVEGRLDDRILTGGEVVDATQVADALTSLDGVADAAVVGIEDPEWGERVGALVAVEAGRDLTADVVRSQCRDRLPGYAVPKSVALARELPRTPSGTVDRRAVEARLREGDAQNETA